MTCLASSLYCYIDKSADILRATADSVSEQLMEQAVASCVRTLRSGKAILVCGNGGSAADAQHITGELVGRFMKDRRALRCICLSDSQTTATAWGNDVGFDGIFARQVEAFGEREGVLIAISTSGNSPNVIKAAQQARGMGMDVIGLTGEGGGKLAEHATVLFAVPIKITPFVQQVHTVLYHWLCARIEEDMS